VVLPWLADRDTRLRVAACETIEASPTPHSVAALGRVLGDADAKVRRAAAAAMGASGLADAVSPLLGHLDDGSGLVRLEVVRALGRIGDLRAVVPLVSKLQDAEPAVRRAAARALGELGDRRATSTLMLALQDASLPVRVQALEALGKLRANEATAPIAAVLAAEQSRGSRGGSAPLRDAALQSLGRIGSPEAIALLVERLADEGPVPIDGDSPAPVRAALRVAGDAAVPALLVRLRSSTSRRAAAGAAMALAAIGERNALEPLVKATQRGSVSLEAGLQALAVLGDDRALPFVLEQLEHPDPRVRRLAVEVAAQLHNPERPDGRVVDVVRSRIRDLRTPLAERVALARLLGRTGAPRAQKLLLQLMGSESDVLRTAVAKALGELGRGGPAVDQVLLEALGDTDPALRAAAAKALGRSGRDAAAAALLHRLGVAAEQDRGALAIALSGALSRSRDPGLVQKVRAAFAAVPARARDALLEGLGRMGTAEARALLDELRRTPDGDDRRKIAEALGGHSGGEQSLIAMLADPDPTVRANAAWSLGRVGRRAALAPLTKLLGDLDVAVAGNAAVAVGHVAARAKASAASAPLCKALVDYRSYVRANALNGLRLAAGRCDAGAVRRVLARDRSWRVRLAAADLMRAQQRAGTTAELDRRALGRCAVEDRDATVAERCRSDWEVPSASDDIIVFVVPEGRTTPSARAPFALLLGDGTLRLGVADRRGALFELDAPAGRIELAVPAALAP
jgi:HEAT repeat protein